jgi:hypothetical protein
LLDEGPRLLTDGLAHELQNAAEFALLALGLLAAGCAELEVRAFEAQAIAMRALYPDDLPNCTDWGRG